MGKREDFNAALKDAMKSKDALATATLRLILAALKDRDITARTKGGADGVDDNEILSMLQSMIKQREESAKSYSDAGRCDLADREEAEVEIIRKFLPEQLSDEKVKEVIRKISGEIGAHDIKDMGRLMNELKTRYAGQIEMKKASQMVKEHLS